MKVIKRLTFLVLILLGIFFVYGKVISFLKVDSCLDNGGSWNYKNGICDSSIYIEVINYKCAVILVPSLKKIDKLKKGISKDEFFTAVDDNEYYMSLSDEYLDSVNCKKVRMDSEGEVIFRTLNQKTFKISLNELSWGVILFNGIDKPFEADVTDISADYEKYMKNVKR